MPGRPRNASDLIRLGVFRGLSVRSCFSPAVPPTSVSGAETPPTLGGDCVRGVFAEVLSACECHLDQLSSRRKLSMSCRVVGLVTATLAQGRHDISMLVVRIAPAVEGVLFSSVELCRCCHYLPPSHQGTVDVVARCGQPGLGNECYLVSHDPECFPCDSFWWE